MTSEIKMAFAHPVERSVATSDGQPLDRISLRDHVVEVEIGAFQKERGVTQRVCFNVVVEVAPVDHSTDDVDLILSYDRVTEAIAIELAAERLNLLETLAERIAERILLEPQAVRAFVRIEKLDRGPGALGVEIVRAQDGHVARPAPSLDGVPHPRIVILSNEARDHGSLPVWLDQLAADAAPVILCVAAPDVTPPKAGHPLAQRRIDLLAIEQNAWVLAARDARCVVVETRTELDWGMKHDQISVWAPSKLVLDSVEGPGAKVRSAESLAIWLAETLSAREILSIGVDLPSGTKIPARVFATSASLEKLPLS